MEFFWLPITLIATFFIVLLVTYICYKMAFYSKNLPEKEEFPIPPGKIYKPYRETMIGWMKEERQMKKEEFFITSFDGLKLHAKYYEYKKGAITEIMFHGYRGNSERDLCGGVQRCFSIGRNALIVDQRGCGQSEGNVISFGINESKDCLSWIDFAIKHFGSDAKFILCGISMGASTVLTAAGEQLPSNIVGILADCGYSDAKTIIKKVIRQMHLPANILYPFVKLGARIYGGFKLEETSPLTQLPKCKLPVIFFHGESDDFVPCEMSEINYQACTCPKRLVTIKGAGHGLAYLVDPEGYLDEICDFFSKNGVETKRV